MSLKIWDEGEKLDAQDLNENFGVSHGSRVIYTGTAFNTTSADSSQTNEHVIAIAANTVKAYIIIEVCARSVAYAGGFGAGNVGSTVLKYSVEETGEGYTERFNQTISSATAAGVSANQANRDSQTASIRFIYEPTTAEKTTGMNIKIESTSTSGANSSSSLTNVQTVVHLH